MAINSKTIAKNTIVLYVRMIVLMLISLYTSRVVLHALGVEDYGLYNVIGGVVSILGFLSNTMATSSSRFITVAIGTNDIDYRIKTFSTVFWVNCLLAIIVVVFAETLGLWFLLNKMNIPEMRETSAFWVLIYGDRAFLELLLMNFTFAVSIFASTR